MSAVNRGRGDVGEAVRSVREVGDIAREHGVRVAVEFNSQAEQLNALAPMREIVSRAGHPSVGLLLDTYHLGRTGASPREIDDLRPDEIAYVQYSDVPRTGLEPGKALDRLPPGQGSVPFREFFDAFARQGYEGYASYEAPNPAAWKRPAADVGAGGPGGDARGAAVAGQTDAITEIDPRCITRVNERAAWARIAQFDAASPLASKRAGCGWLSAGSRRRGSRGGWRRRTAAPRPRRG